MSETETPETAENAETSENPAEPETSQSESDEQLGESGKKALIDERKARKAAERSAAELKKQLDETATAQMSDLERAQSEAKTAVERAEKAERDVLRYRIAAEHGISSADADLFLTGSDEETMSAQAVRYTELNQAPTTPRPDPSQGAKGTNQATSPADAFAAAFGGRI